MIQDGGSLAFIGTPGGQDAMHLWEVGLKK